MNRRPPLTIDEEAIMRRMREAAAARIIRARVQRRFVSGARRVAARVLFPAFLFAVALIVAIGVGFALASWLGPFLVRN